ncbi:HAD family hydrolase [Alicyclobacillus hesperidum]|uniref:HAD family hydrolase n=1 Tax=Alicyclobacillus hesperidum TaxID=89784 RepID=UPI0002F22BB8|nr:HAD family hydrolase [Alicyclobacillus hesperidum]
MNQDAYTRLANCNLFIFDLDGTVYAETDHFEHYLQQLARFVGDEAREAFLREAQESLAEQGGRFYGQAFTRLTGEPVAVEDEPSEQHLHVDDPWGVLQAVAARHGVSVTDRDKAFLRTRDFMAGPFPMTPLAGLRDAMLALRSEGRHVVLATNSPEPDSRAILRKLELEDVLEDYVFQARKPYRTAEHFTRWLAHYDIPPEQAVSVGDHYRNEMRPAIRLGMNTIYIDRYIGQPRADVTVQLRHPGELADILRRSLRSGAEE